MNVRYRMELSQAERDQLTDMLSGGKHSARKLKRAQILLAADGGVSEAVDRRQCQRSPSPRSTGQSVGSSKATSIWR